MMIYIILALGIIATIAMYRLASDTLQIRRGVFQAKLYNAVWHTFREVRFDYPCEGELVHGGGEAGEAMKRENIEIAKQIVREIEGIESEIEALNCYTLSKGDKFGIVELCVKNEKYPSGEIIMRFKVDVNMVDIAIKERLDSLINKIHVLEIELETL